MQRAEQHDRHADLQCVRKCVRLNCENERPSINPAKTEASSRWRSILQPRQHAAHRGRAREVARHQPGASGD